VPKVEVMSVSPDRIHKTCGLLYKHRQYQVFLPSFLLSVVSIIFSPTFQLILSTYVKSVMSLKFLFQIT